MTDAPHLHNFFIFQKQICRKKGKKKTGDECKFMWFGSWKSNQKSPRKGLEGSCVGGIVSK